MAASLAPSPRRRRGSRLSRRQRRRKSRRIAEYHRGARLSGYTALEQIAVRTVPMCRPDAVYQHPQAASTSALQFPSDACGQLLKRGRRAGQRGRFLCGFGVTCCGNNASVAEGSVPRLRSSGQVSRANSRLRRSSSGGRSWRATLSWRRVSATSLGLRISSRPLKSRSSRPPGRGSEHSVFVWKDLPIRALQPSDCEKPFSAPCYSPIAVTFAWA